MAKLFDGPSLPAPKGSSAPQNTAVGSGSRPVPSKIKIANSAPSDPATQGRSVPGALK
ncbi:MAG TPA: hypothetical protein VFW46_20170 [Stellaceae bacterium]|nr:hypothetical protein [Stellaceae bacterium]